MSIDILGRNLVLFFVLILLQILIFNNLGISSLDVVPAFFVLFVLFLPFEIPKWVILLSSFLLGIIIDVFSDTSGLNAAATTLIAYFRPFILLYMAPRGGYDAGALPRAQYLGMAWFVRYSLTLIFIHQFAFYFIENFGFHNFFRVILKVLIGSIYSFVLVFISQFIIFRKK
jgi:rod shape-determining protein MreD